MKKINDSLTEEELIVLRDKGTERPFTGKFNSFFEDGIYKCKNCKKDLFQSNSKFDAGCGWPSFFEAIDEEAIIYKKMILYLVDQELKYYVQVVKVIWAMFLMMAQQKKLVLGIV